MISVEKIFTIVLISLVALLLYLVLYQFPEQSKQLTETINRLCNTSLTVEEVVLLDHRLDLTRCIVSD